VKPTIPEVLPRFRAYHIRYPEWGALHIVLADGNVSDADVAFCREVAEQRGDAEGLALATLLAQMSRTQRTKLGRLP
jgi:hypothetical protein